MPKDLPKGVPVHLRMDRKTDPEFACPDPFHYTKEVAKYRRTEDLLARDARLQYAQDRADDPAGTAAPSNFNGPYTPVDLENIEDALLGRQQFLCKVWKKLADAECYAPRALLRDVLVAITNAVLQDPSDIEDVNPVKGVDIDFLLSLTLPSRSSRIELPVIEPPTEYDKLVILADQVDEFVAERAWAGSNAIIKLLAFLNMLNDRRKESKVAKGKGEKTGTMSTFKWTSHDLAKLLPILHQTRRIR
jgi:hypothetical protein